ncbi:hypothetical protein CCACVL1_24425 [Corchorus capsularis]|uniref:Uncharacterized protein n=1 Tax=Corchorus capsularis TaxID=210143 RepID=A0A1R3GPL9_COCAP|nr:hypothetical protein CCACVL1_24425 [Corchorus capsularis]
MEKERGLDSRTGKARFLQSQPPPPLLPPLLLFGTSEFRHRMSIPFSSHLPPSPLIIYYYNHQQLPR